MRSRLPERPPVVRGRRGASECLSGLVGARMGMQPRLPESRWGMREDRSASARLPGFRGSGWECDRGYRKVDQSCVAIAVPDNAYLDSSGDRWKCERGFRESGDSCAPLEIPQEGYVGRSGNDWECNRGYRKRRRVVRRGRGAFKRLPRLVGTRLGLRARLQERTPLVPGLPGANERSPRLLGKQLDLRSGLSAAGRDLYRGQGIEEPGRPWAGRALGPERR